MKQTPLYTDFTAGELSEKYKGRVDDRLYEKGASIFYNMRPLPQGGFKAVGGSRYCASLPEDANYNYRLVPFVVDENLQYLLAFAVDSFIVYQVEDDGSLSNVTTVSHGALYSEAKLREIQFCQNYNTLYLTHRSHPPKKIALTGTVWSCSAIPIVTNEGETIPFQAVDEHPGCCAFFNGRLFLAGTGKLPQGIWASKSFEPENFTWWETLESIETNLKPEEEWADPQVPETVDVTVTKNVINDDQAFSFEIASDQNDSIVGLTPNEDLVVQTISSEWIVPEDITANDISAKLKSRHGSSRIPGRLIDGKTVMLQRDGKRVWAYDGDEKNMDLSFQSDHIMEGYDNGGIDGVYGFDYARSPDPTIYFLKKDGEIACLLYSEDRKINAWYIQGARGGIKDVWYESLAVVQTGVGDRVYAIGRDKATYNRWIERLDEDVNVRNALQVSFDADGKGGYFMSMNSTSAYVDGLIGSHTVKVGNYITAAEAANQTRMVGERIVSTMETMDIAPETDLGTSLMKKRRVNEAFLYIVKGGRIQVGYRGAYDRRTGENLDRTVTATGVAKVGIRKGHAEDLALQVRRCEPFPVLITAIMPEVEVNEI